MRRAFLPGGIGLGRQWAFHRGRVGTTAASAAANPGTAGFSHGPIVLALATHLIDPFKAVRP